MSVGGFAAVSQGSSQPPGSQWQQAAGARARGSAAKLDLQPCLGILITFFSQSQRISRSSLLEEVHVGEYGELGPPTLQRVQQLRSTEGVWAQLRSTEGKWAQLVTYCQVLGHVDGVHRMWGTL
eukprot:COSAG01_NODE_30252_length_619_cov_3.734615_1_plen_124_part_00